MSLISNRFFRISLLVLLWLSIVFMARQVEYLFYPFMILLTTIFLPFIFAGIGYYLSIGIVEFLTKKTTSKKLSIFIVAVSLILSILIISVFLVPLVLSQLVNFIRDIPAFTEQIYSLIVDLYSSNKEWLPNLNTSFDDLIKQGSLVLGNFFTTFLSSINWFIQFLVSTVFTFFIAIFLYVFMLIDGHKLPQALLRFMPEKYEREATLILDDMNNTIRSYVRAQLIVCTFVGLLATIALYILDVSYFLPLGLFIFATNIIPYFGPFLGATPAVIIAFLDDPQKGLYVAIAITIVQQLDANVISPLVQGKTMKIHPITITVVLLVSGQLAGILGMLLAVPFYAVSKVTLLHLIRFAHLRTLAKNEQSNLNSKPPNQ